ncbi:hypothetical protein IEQ34_004559 [Dendrobium chrysotoxum]|uniref:Uncharacterized protein n=1 Tax=Dendrobium chrysotoxum TaxID=161865 RepID=A0AAV7HEC2_DENCH|nr:hypothetical protein IEQ34_004559 [Dendrobium chrysotoxum]
MSIVMGLIALFKDRGVVLSSECLSRMGCLFSDAAKDLLRILKFPDLDALYYEVRYLSRYIDEEYLFKGEYKKKYDSKVKEMRVVEDQLTGCRAELANKITSASSQNERMDRLHIELVEAQTTIKQQKKNQQILEAENKRLQRVLSEKEAQQLPSTVIEEFKKSYAFKIIIEDHIQEARNHIYNVEVKALEAECTEDGFIRGFMKGVCIVHRKTGAEIEGLTPSQASGDASSDSGGEELESELQQAFALEEDEDDIEIL